jgi:hypothetical protein
MDNPNNRIRVTLLLCSGRRADDEKLQNPYPLQEYLNEFCYRYNRHFVEKQIPNRLLNLAIIHTPLKST